jgi:hypothetical protein
MKRNIILLFLLTCFCQSCGKGDSYGKEIQIAIDYKNLSEVNLSKFADNVQIIRLETNDSCLIGDVSNVQLFDDRIYILDELSNRLFVFDRNGKFIFVLDRAGNGPGEYIHLKDFVVNSDGIFLLDFTGRSINHYNFDLKFIRKMKSTSYSSNLLVADDHTFLLYNIPSMKPGDYRLTQLDSSGQVLNKSFPQKTILEKTLSNWASSNIFQYCNQTSYYSGAFDYVIYANINGVWEKNVRFSFGDKTFPADENLSDEDMADEDFPYIFRRNYFVSEQFIIIDFILKNDRYHSFYNKRNRELDYGKIKNDMIPNYNRFFPRWFSSNYLIESVDAMFVLDDFKELMKWNKSLENLKEDDNPVLVMYNLK